MIKSGFFSFYSASGRLTAVGSYENNMIYPTYLRYEGIEALRLAIEAPDWEPELRNGRPVDFSINLQIDFSLKQGDKII